MMEGNVSLTLSWTTQLPSLTQSLTDEDVSQKVLTLYRDWYPAILIWISLFILLGIPGNSLMLLAFIKDPSLRSPTNYLIFSQSLADLVTCLTSPIFVAINYTKLGLMVATTKKMLCLVGLAMPLFSLLTSLTSLLILSTERFIAVAFPYSYYNIVTERLAVTTIAIKWGTVLCIMMIPMFGWNVWRPGNACMSMTTYPREFFIFFYLLPSLIMIIIMTILNIIICYIAMSKQHVTPQPAVGSISAAPDTHTSARLGTANPAKAFCFCTPKVKSKKEVDYKITKTFLKVVGVFYFSWLPFIVLTTLSFLYPQLQRSPEWYSALHDITKGLLGLNGICNPFIYAKGNFQWKKVFWKVVGQ